MKNALILILLLCALSAQSATNRVRIIRLLPTLFPTNASPRIKATVPGCLPMTTSWAAFLDHDQFVQALNLGPMFGNTETNVALWPRPGALTYVFGAGGMTVESCVPESTRWIWRFAVVEYVPGYDIPEGPPISSRGKSVKAVASRKTVKTKNGDVPAGPPMPPTVVTPTKDMKGATRLLLR